jgi:hypothetical protein
MTAAVESKTNSLFTELDETDSAQVSGGCYYRRRSYFRPSSYYRPYYSYQRPSHWGSYGGSSINQTVNVNVVYND